MTTWTLRRKILGGYGLVLLLLVVVLAWALVNLSRLGSASEAILSENYRSIVAAERMTNVLERQDSAVLLYLLGDEEPGLRQFRENQNTFSQWLARAKDNLTIEGEAAVPARIDSAYAVYLTRFGQLVRSDAASADAYEQRILPAFLPVREATLRLRDLNQQAMFAASARAEHVARRAMWSVGLTGLLALGLGLAFCLVLSRRLVRPIRSMRAATRHLVEGHYDVEVEAHSADELGALARQFNEMTTRLRAYRDLNVEQIMAERRKSEAILQSIDDGLIVVDGALRIQNVNPAAEEALHVPHGQAQGRHLLEVIDDQPLAAYVRETAEAGRPPRRAEHERFMHLQRNGDARQFQFAAAPVYGASDEMLGVVILLRDVTKLRELDRLKSEFVAAASHELKTPLTSLAMSIGLLEEHVGRQLGADDRELLEVAREDVDRLRTLVDDLLDLARLESGRIELDLEAAQPERLAARAVGNLAAQAGERGIDLRCAVPTDLPAVRADATKAVWVLNNLLSNALRYTDAGGRVHVAAEPMGRHVRFWVEDTGAGIAPAEQARIFDKFVHVPNGDAPIGAASGGSGLGLAICREMVRAHGGTIWVDSAPGRGSTFSFTLPVA